ncbi:MAG: hypothetical protein V9E94_14905 [Microthrixaceae bacterium]
MTIRVFLLDDHEIVRRGVRELLEAAGDIEVVGEAGTAGAGAGEGPAELHLMSPCSTCCCPTGRGVEVCRDVRPRRIPTWGA